MTPTDDQVRAIFRAPTTESNKSIGQRLKLPTYVVYNYRSLTTRSALRTAHRLNLLGPVDPSSAWNPPHAAADNELALIEATIGGEA